LITYLNLTGGVMMMLMHIVCCRGDGKAQKSKEEDEESLQVCVQYIQQEALQLPDMQLGLAS
jgi:hypothetical protein